MHISAKNHTKLEKMLNRINDKQ